jgi:hypothetical protein
VFTLLDSSNYGMASANVTRGMNLYPRLSVLFIFICSLFDGSFSLLTNNICHGMKV